MNEKPNKNKPKKSIQWWASLFTILSFPVAVAALVVAVMSLYVQMGIKEEVNVLVSTIPYPFIVAGGRIEGDSENHKNRFAALPGDVVELQMIVRNTTCVVEGLSVNVSLPDCVELIKGSTFLFNSLNIEGEQISDDNLLNWVRLGVHSLYNQETGKGESVIVYKVRIKEASEVDLQSSGIINIGHAAVGYDKNGRTITDTVYQYVSIIVDYGSP